MHKVLERQIRKFLGKSLPKSREWEEFCKSVSETYDHFDEDRELLENSLTITSKELTDRYKVLKESEERLNIVVQATNDVIWDWDLLSNTVWWNNNFESSFGYKLSEIEPDSSSWTKRIHPEDLKRVEESIKSAIESKDPSWIDEYRFRHANGDYLYMLDRGYISRDEQGKAVRMIGAMMNLTERKSQEERLRELTNRIKLILESTDQGIYGLDLQGNCTLINKSALSMAGLSENEAIGKNMHNIMHYKKSDGTPYPTNECSIIRTLKTGEGTKTDNEVFWKKDGSPFAVEYSSYPIVENKEIKGVVVAFADITKRKEEQMEITKLSRAVELSPDNILITDKKGNIQYVNLAFEHLTGYSREEVIGKNPRILKSENHDGGFYKKMWETILSGNNFSGQFANKKKNGEVYYEDKIIFPIKDQSGNIVNFVSSGKDATERKIASDKLREKTEQLERFNKIAVGRELRMIELKKKIRELESRLATDNPSVAARNGNSILDEVPKH